MYVAIWNIWGRHRHYEISVCLLQTVYLSRNITRFPLQSKFRNITNTKRCRWGIFFFFQFYSGRISLTHLCVIHHLIVWFVVTSMPSVIKIVRNIVGNFTKETILAHHNTSFFSVSRKKWLNCYKHVSYPWPQTAYLKSEWFFMYCSIKKGQARQNGWLQDQS
jgi:hypothetical protein